MGCLKAGQIESLMVSKGGSSIVAMLPGSHLGSTLGDPAGVIKPRRVVFAVRVGVVQMWGSSESHLLICLKEQGIYRSHL